jgi:hypothetical protein
VVCVVISLQKCVFAGEFHVGAGDNEIEAARGRRS